MKLVCSAVLIHSTGRGKAFTDWLQHTGLRIARHELATAQISMQARSWQISLVALHVQNAFKKDPRIIILRSLALWRQKVGS